MINGYTYTKKQHKKIINRSMITEFRGLGKISYKLKFSWENEVQ